MAQTRVENRTHLRPYSVVRDYKLFGKENQTTKAEVIADVTFVPPDHNQARGIRISLRSTIPRGQCIQVSGQVACILFGDSHVDHRVARDNALGLA
jgi:hypothetical protein